MIIPTPPPTAPIVRPSAAASPTPTPVSGLVTPAPLRTPNPLLPSRSGFYVDSGGVERAIYYAGHSLPVACAANSTCTVYLAPGSAITTVLQPTAAWHVTPDNSGATPVVQIIPDPGAPDMGITVETKGRIYHMRLHVDPFAINATYGYLFPDAHGRVVVPKDDPVQVIPDGSADSPETAPAPIAPEPCPAQYRATAENNPSFWPSYVQIVDDGVSIAFPAGGIIPVAAVPFADSSSNNVDLQKIADISQSGEINGRSRIVRITDCYPTIVLYTGFGRDRRAVVLEAQKP